MPSRDAGNGRICGVHKWPDLTRPPRRRRSRSGDCTTSEHSEDRPSRAHQRAKEPTSAVRRPSGRRRRAAVRCGERGGKRVVTESGRPFIRTAGRRYDRARRRAPRGASAAIRLGIEVRRVVKAVGRLFVELHPRGSSAVGRRYVAAYGEIRQATGERCGQGPPDTAPVAVPDAGRAAYSVGTLAALLTVDRPSLLQLSGCHVDRLRT